MFYLFLFFFSLFFSILFLGWTYTISFYCICFFFWAKQRTIAFSRTCCSEILALTFTSFFYCSFVDCAQPLGCCSLLEQQPFCLLYFFFRSLLFFLLSFSSLFLFHIFWFFLPFFFSWIRAGHDSCIKSSEIWHRLFHRSPNSFGIYKLATAFSVNTSVSPPDQHRPLVSIIGTLSLMLDLIFVTPIIKSHRKLDFFSKLALL